MTADSIPVNPNWPMNEAKPETEVESEAYIFSVENPEIDRELKELETARGPRRMELLIKLTERLYSMRSMMEEELQDTDWWDAAKPHPGLRAFFAKHLKISYEIEDLTRGFMVPSRGRPKGANAYRNSVVLERMSSMVDSGRSIAESSRLVSQELAAGNLEPLTIEILEPKTIANLWTTHQKNQSLDDD